MNFFKIGYSLTNNPFYKIKRMKIINALSELLFALMYLTSLLLFLGDKHDKNNRKNTSYLLLIFATSILALEFLNFILEILIILISLCYTKKKKKEN